MGAMYAAFPLEHVIEIMRPLPVRVLSSVPPWVRGAALIRGIPTPVIDLSVLLVGAAEQTVTRFVCLRVPGAGGTRTVAVALGAVEGVRSLDVAQLSALPPLLAEAQGDARLAVAALDRELCALLEAFHVLPESLWQVVAGAEVLP
jgi:purine-binding chemotaxis protein CheW